ncbi:Glycoside hydrolase family 92 protein [Mycena chlorophos]|uniref:Glycoside hydrolase family 92 protein n=1 Tax=Mycena chlorophos TaxID=658473 RepID=A0A8H6W5X8_MYCCL|nr:Glycoside hydrolase family 92 protein [Mycena chlorophos]
MRTSVSVAAFGVVAAAASAFDPLQHVNLFIGTSNGGNVFPGATVPHGMVKVGMDTDGDNFAGYDPNPLANVTGFSQLHQSGTGGAVPLSNFKLFPIPECPVNNNHFEQCLTFISGRKTLRKLLPSGLPDDFASPGYFSTNLSTDVRAELTATRRTALHRSRASSPELSIDPTTGRMLASGNYATSFGIARYNAYACVDFRGEGDGYDFSGPSEWGPYKINYPDLNGVNLLQHYYSWGSEHGGLMFFPANPNGSPSSILVRVGVSFISTAQASQNAEEIPDFDFAGVVSDAEDQWRDILNRVQVNSTGVDDDTVTLLVSLPDAYRPWRLHWRKPQMELNRTLLRRVLLQLYVFCLLLAVCACAHVTKGHLPDAIPPRMSVSSLTTAVLTTLQMSLDDPENFAHIVRGMINIQQHQGWLPEAREAGQQQFIQGGSDGDEILAEFYVKFSKYAAALNVSATDLYNALLADAEDTPPNWNLQGRQADVWKEKGYIPSDTTYAGGANTKQVSRALEYAFDDFAISQVAKMMGKTADAKKYASRAQNFHNSWNENVTLSSTSTGSGLPPNNSVVAGFFQPRFANGTWNFTDPRHCSVHDPTQSTCFLNAIRRDGFYESSPIVYSQYVPQDTAALIALQGGPDAFTARLDWIFTSSYFDPTDEPSQQIPFMYHYANAPGQSTQRSRQLIASSFNTSLNGLPGNDDSGAMASYVVWYLAGMYPLPATQQILLSSPYFPEISFTNPLLGKTTTLRTKNFVGNPTNGTGGTVFVKSVSVNGKPYKSNCYLDWDVFTSGSLVEIEVTDDIGVTCGEGKDALPPSLSTGGYD